MNSVWIRGAFLWFDGSLEAAEADATDGPCRMVPL